MNRKPAAYALADQFVSSASNFLVGVVIGRFGGASELGTYSIALFVWLVMIGLNRALLTEPLLIFVADLESRDSLRNAARSQLFLAIAMTALIAGVSAVLAAVGTVVWKPLLMLAVLLPLLLAQDMWRAVAFGVHRPERALVNDVAFIVVQLAVTAWFISADLTTASWFILAWGIGAAAGAAVGFISFACAPPLIPAAHMFRELWGRSRWLMGDFLTLTAVREAYFLIIAVMVPFRDLGGLRAAESLMGPSTVIKLSGGNVGLPMVTRAFRDGGYRSMIRLSNRLTLWVGGAQWLYCVVMIVAGPTLMKTLYGDEFTEYNWVIYVVTLQYAIAVINFGPSIALKVVELTKYMWVTRSIVAAFSLPLAAVVTSIWGFAAAVWAAVVVAVLVVVATHLVYLPGIRLRIWPGSGVAGMDTAEAVGVAATGRVEHVRHRR